MSLDKKLADFKGQQRVKSSNASLLFPELQKELQENPNLAGNLQGLFVIEVLNRGKRWEEWFLVFYGKQKQPTISREKPSFPNGKAKVQVAIIEIEDKVFVNVTIGYF
jgi:hypothetical protein